MAKSVPRKSTGVKVHLSRELTAFDHEFEDPLFPPKVVEEPTDYHKKLASIYNAMCSKLNIVPVSHIERKLSDATINIRSRGIGPKGVKAIAVALVKNTTLEHLDVGDNDIGFEGVRSLAQMLEENTSIVHLDLSENKMNTACVESICRVVAKQDALRILKLCSVGCQNTEISYIKNMLDNNMHLKELHLAQNEISTEGCYLLKRAISDNDTLEVLDLSWNHIRGKGAVSIAQGLGENRGLKCLNIAWNGFAMDGSKALAEALRKNKTLTELDISSNRIHHEALATLLLGLRKNTTLSVLKLKGNPLTPAATVVLLHEISNLKQHSLREIDISDIAIPGEFLMILEDLQSTQPLMIRHGPLLTHSAMTKDGTTQSVVQPMEASELLFNLIENDGLRIVELFKLNEFTSGSVTKEQLKTGLLNANLKITTSQLDGLINMLETDRHNKIDLVKLIEAQRQYDQKKANQSEH